MDTQDKVKDEKIDYESLADVLSRLSEHSLKNLKNYLSNMDKETLKDNKTNTEFLTSFLQASGKIFSDPAKLMKLETEYIKDLSLLVNKSMMKFWGVNEEADNDGDKRKRIDKRFKHPEWEKNPWFGFLRDLYLLNSKTITNSIQDVTGIDEKTKQKADFFSKQLVNALSPSNFLATNPELIKETIDSKGNNLIRGLRNLLDDLERSPCEIQIRNTDTTAFELGKDIATTPGYVVHQNDLTQLIQYVPTTKTVHNRPILIIPPWINKYYILDLRQDNSLIKYLVDQGYTVFTLSWVNPDETHAHYDFEDYMMQGPVEALRVIEERTGVKPVNTIGYCMGGTLLSCATSYLTSIGEDDRIASSTYMASLIDFSKPGDMGVFIDEDQIQDFERKMNEKGFLDGCAMSNTFNMLRSNDLVWSSVINNYMKGKDPVPFDLLYWNSDSTNMPAKMHAYYLRNMYLENKLKTPGSISLKGEPIDVTKITKPSYFISTYEDHIALWEGTYLGAKLMTGTVRFVLGGSGHIAGIVNPPQKNKYYYMTNNKLPESSEEWLKTATMNDGSWWPDWIKWNKKYRGKKVPAREITLDENILDTAPGCYVTFHLQRPESAVCTATFL